MRTYVDATWVGGAFRPDESLSIADQTRMRLTIEPIDGQQGSAQTAWEAIRQRLHVRPILATGLRYTRDELHEGR
jgi:hypothetical protein